MVLCHRHYLNYQCPITQKLYAQGKVLNEIAGLNSINLDPNENWKPSRNLRRLIQKYGREHCVIIQVILSPKISIGLLGGLVSSKPQRRSLHWRVYFVRYVPTTCVATKLITALADIINLKKVCARE